MTGRVKWFDTRKGYGFITPDDRSPEVFIHHSAILGQTGRRNLNEGDQVTFEVVAGQKGPKAANLKAVRIITLRLPSAMGKTTIAGIRAGYDDRYPQRRD